MPGEIKERLEHVFEARQATVLTEVLVDAYGALAKTADLNALTGIVKELAAAQERTEARLESLTERVESLAAAQERTEETLQRLVEAHAETRRQLGGLAMTVGYTLENEAYRALPGLLEKDFGIVVHGRLKRAYVTDSEGQAMEVNLIGEGIREGRKVVVVGESKAQLSANDVDRFERRRLRRLQGVLGEIFPVLITHMTTAPDVEEYAREKGIALYYSYDF